MAKRIITLICTVYIGKTIMFPFNQNKTIGIIICKQDNKYVIKYCSDDRIIAREYELLWYNLSLTVIHTH